MSDRTISPEELVDPETVFDIPAASLPMHVAAAGRRNPLLGAMLIAMYDKDREKCVPWPEAMSRCVLVLADGMNQLLGELAEASCVTVDQSLYTALRDYARGTEPAPEPNIDNGLRQRIILPGEDHG